MIDPQKAKIMKEFCLFKLKLLQKKRASEATSTIRQSSLAIVIPKVRHLTFVNILTGGHSGLYRI
jgi:hypothetical protein